MVLLQIEHLGLKFVSITIHSYIVCRGNWVICWKLFNITWFCYQTTDHIICIVGGYQNVETWTYSKLNKNILSIVLQVLWLCSIFLKYFVEFGYSKAAWSNLFAITVTNTASYKTTISETFRLLNIYTSRSLYKVRNFQSKLFHFLMGKQKEERYK